MALPPLASCSSCLSPLPGRLRLAEGVRREAWPHPGLRQVRCKEDLRSDSRLAQWGVIVRWGWLGQTQAGGKSPKIRLKEKTRIQIWPTLIKGASGSGAPTSFWLLIAISPYNLLIFPLCLHLDRPCPQNPVAPEVLKPPRWLMLSGNADRPEPWAVKS